MLSRTAESLYWLARHMERAETMARLLEVGYRMAMMPSAAEGYRNEWASLIAAAGAASPRASAARTRASRWVPVRMCAAIASSTSPVPPGPNAPCHSSPAWL